MERYTGAFYLLGAFTLAGTSVIAGRFVTELLGTFTIAAGSLFFALLGLLPLCGRRLKNTIQQLSMHDWIGLALQALLGIFLFRLFLLQGLLHTSAGEAGILTGATPATTALLAWLVLQEPLHWLRLCGIGSTVIGILILQGVGSNVGFLGEHLTGNLLILCAVMSESSFNILSRRRSVQTALNQVQILEPITQTTLVVGIALLFCIMPALFEQPAAALLSLGITGWMALLWYGLFVTALAFILWYAGIKRCDATMAAAFSGMMPFTALVLSVLLLNEQPGSQQWIGGFLVILGMVCTGLKIDDKQAAQIPVLADRK